MIPMKILQVNKFYYPATGGIERVIQYIAEGLCDKTDMKVLVCQQKGPSFEEKINGVSVYRAKSYGTLFSMPISLDFINKFKKMSRDRDIIHLHMPFPLADMACMFSGYKGKIVLWWHSDVVKQKKAMFLYKPFMKFLLERADVIMVASKGIISGSHYLKPYSSKCIVIPLAVGDDIWHDGEAYLKKQIVDYDKSKTHRNVKFLFVGRLVYYKGCSILLEALKYVEAAELTIVGSGELEEDLKRQCYELGIEDRVIFTGAVSDEQMKQHFKETDVFVLPSIERSEAFGIVQLEAMAYGKPVINTNLSSGVPDVSLHGVTGLTVEPKNVDALAYALRQMAENPNDRIVYGNAAKKRVDDMFTLNRVLPQILSAYKELMILK